MFDVAQLDESTLGHFEFVLNSPSWQDVFRPYWENLERMYTELLLDPLPSVRLQHGGDEALRQGANMVRKFLQFCDKIVAETQIERMQRAREEQGKLPTVADFPEETEF